MLGGTADINAAGTQGLGVLNFAAAETVMRLLGEYAIGPRTAPAVGDVAFVTVGIGVVSSDAAALGATALPDPADEPEYPWLYWADHALAFTATSLLDHGQPFSLRQGFDVKSMRKIKPRESLAFVVQNTSTGDPPLRLVAGNTRVLIAT